MDALAGVWGRLSTRGSVEHAWTDGWVAWVGCRRHAWVARERGERVGARLRRLEKTKKKQRKRKYIEPEEPAAEEQEKPVDARLCLNCRKYPPKNGKQTLCNKCLKYKKRTGKDWHSGVHRGANQYSQ